MSFLTCFWLLPQNEHLSRSPPSPMRATRCFSFACPARGPRVPVLDGTPSAPGRAPLSCRESGDSALGGRRQVRGLAGGNDLVDETVLQGLLRGEDLVALDVVADLLDGAAGVLGDHLLQEGTHAQHLLGL